MVRMRAARTSTGNDEGVAPLEILWCPDQHDDDLALCVDLLEHDLVFRKGPLQG